MEILQGFPRQPLGRPTHLSIGSYDGVHRGHQALVTEMVQAAEADDCLAGVVTFEPHPLRVLRPSIPLVRLTSDAERAGLLAALGLDLMCVLPFTRETANTSALDFMRSLVQHMSMRTLWIGPDFALGRGREGNAERLRRLGVELGYEVVVVPPFDLDGGPVRSSRIRTLLADEGSVRSAAELLGRPYQVWGDVKHGAHRGRSLGFPTANLDVSPDRLIPAHGVYACWAWRESTRVNGLMRGYPAVVNVGVRPSFGGGSPSTEAFLLDFEGDLYGETMGLSFIERLRGEQRFPDIGALVGQIRSDVDQARQILASPSTRHGVSGNGGWEELRHTADWAVRVTGDSPRELFARAASAMFTLQDADATRSISLAHAVDLEAADSSQLLVSWLNALLLGQELGGELYTAFEISEISPRGLRAVAYGYAGRPAHTAVKAVTYYDLNVVETAEGWWATVTFDV